MEAIKQNKSSSENHMNVGKNKNLKAVYHIIEPKTDQEKARWVRMGTAFVNKDNSINVYLEGVPSDFRLHIRDLDPTVQRDNQF